MHSRRAALNTLFTDCCRKGSGYTKELAAEGSSILSTGFNKLTLKMLIDVGRVAG